MWERAGQQNRFVLSLSKDGNMPGQARSQTAAAGYPTTPPEDSPGPYASALTTSSTIFLPSANSIMVLSR